MRVAGNMWAGGCGDDVGGDNRMKGRRDACAGAMQLFSAACWRGACVPASGCDDCFEQPAQQLAPAYRKSREAGATLLRQLSAAS